MAAAIPLQPVPPRGATVESLREEIGSPIGPPKGYPEVATLMGNHPELAMVRRFRGLNARNLLYLQAELVQIENDLLKCEKEDANDKVDIRKQNFSKNFAWVLRNKKENKQYTLIQSMREKLKEYSEDSLLYAALKLIL